MKTLSFLGTLLLTSLVAAQWEITPPRMSLLEGGGLRMAIDDDPGISLYAVHYNINEELNGVEVGQYNFDITEPTGDEWVHENNNLDPPLVVGDVVYYWIYVVHDGIAHQITDMSWEVASSATSTTSSPDTTTINEATTTTASGETTTATDDNGDGNDGDATCTEFPCLIFEDNFDTLDQTVWEHEKTLGGGGNWEFQAYSNNRSNSYVRDGVLYIKPTLTADAAGEAFLSSGTWDIWGGGPGSLCTGPQFYGCFRVGTATNYLNPIMSARLRSVHSFSFKYGKIEVEAQMPRGDWIWPAIWMLPTLDEYGTWPSSGEIDLVESRGNDELNDEFGNHVGNGHMGSTMHWGPFFEGNRFYLTTESSNGNFADTFHTYGLEWNKDGLQFYLDGVETLTVTPPEGGFWELGNYENDFPGIDNPWIREDKMAPFNRDFHIIMNVAVGGTNGFFNDAWTPPKPWDNLSPTASTDFWLAKDDWYPSWNAEVDNGEGAAMKINYVRVWKMSADEL